MKIRPKCDSRNFCFQKHYGYTTNFPVEYSVDHQRTNAVQPPGNMECVLYTIRDIIKDKQGVEINIKDLAFRLGMSNNGTDPARAIKEVIKNGVLIEGTQTKIFPFSSYFAAHTGVFDAFDNTRSAIMLAEYPIMAYGPWYYSWHGGLIQKGEGFACYHSTDNDGWVLSMTTLSTGEPAISCEAWTGQKFLFTREVFNWWAYQYGFGTIVPSTKEIDEKRAKTILETIRDLYVNVVILLQELLKKKNPL